MPGGLLNIIGVGQQDVILTGNPTKTFWKSNYSKYTNFGMQKFRLEYDGQKTISLTNKSQFTFKFKRYGDLVADTYMGINLPHIWSPLHQYSSTNPEGKDAKPNYYIPYEFQWIKHLGTQLIKSIEVNVGGQTLQKYSGDYLTAMIERDFDQTKQALINRMTGNLPEFNDPANAFQRNERYPNAVYNYSPGGAEPSIRGRTLYIPLNAWFNLNTKQAFPLVSLQYNELTITVTLRPIYELFTIRDVKNPGENFPRIAPNFNESYQEMYNFLQSPPQNPDELNKNSNIWNADIHLITTYVFLGEDERRLFATQPQEYLVHDIHETTFEGVSVNERLDLKSMGLVSSWMWFARRDDAYKRNQWTNYTNWEYEGIMPSPSRIPPIHDPKFNATNYLVTPSNETIEGNKGESGYFPPNVSILQSDVKRIPGNNNSPNIIPMFEEQGSTDISNFTVGYQPPNLRTLQADMSCTEDMLPTFKQQGAHRDPSHIGYNPPSISILENDLSEENLTLDIKPLWNEQGATNAGCAKCSEPAPAPAPTPGAPTPAPVTPTPAPTLPPPAPTPPPTNKDFRLTRNYIEELSKNSFVDKYNMDGNPKSLNDAGVFFQAINNYYGQYCFIDHSVIKDHIKDSFGTNHHPISISYDVCGTHCYTYNNPNRITSHYTGITSTTMLMYNQKGNTMIFSDSSNTYLANNVVYKPYNLLDAITEISYNIQFMLDSSNMGNIGNDQYTWTWVDSSKGDVPSDFSFSISPFIYTPEKCNWNTPIITNSRSMLLGDNEICSSISGWDNIIIKESIFTTTSFKSTPLNMQAYSEKSYSVTGTINNSFPWGVSNIINSRCDLLDTTRQNINNDLSYIPDFSSNLHTLFQSFTPTNNQFEVVRSCSNERTHIVQTWTNNSIIIKLIKLDASYYFYNNSCENHKNPYYASVASVSGYMMSHYLEHVNTGILTLDNSYDLSYLSSTFAESNYPKDNNKDTKYMFAFYNMDAGFHTDILYDEPHKYDISNTISGYNTSSKGAGINISDPSSHILWEPSYNSTTYQPDTSNRRDDKFAFMWSLPFTASGVSDISTYHYIDYTNKAVPTVSSIHFNIKEDNKLLPDQVELNMYSLDASFEYRKTYDLIYKSPNKDISQISNPNKIPYDLSYHLPTIRSDISAFFKGKDHIQKSKYYEVSGGLTCYNKTLRCPIASCSGDPAIDISDTTYLMQMDSDNNNKWIFCQDASFEGSIKQYPLINHPDVSGIVNNIDSIMMTNKFPGYDLLSSSAEHPSTNYDTAFDLSSNFNSIDSWRYDTLSFESIINNGHQTGVELDITLGIFNKDAIKYIDWTTICISLSKEELTPYEVLKKINSTLVNIKRTKTLSNETIYIQYFARKSIRADVSINTLTRLINTISADTSMVLDLSRCHDGSNVITHHIVYYGISSDASLITTSTIKTPTFLDGSHTFVSKFTDIDKVECLWRASQAPKGNTYIYLTPSTFFEKTSAEKSSQEITYNLDIFDKGYSYSYTAPAIHDYVYNDYDSVFNTTSPNNTTFRNNQVLSPALTTRARGGRYGSIPKRSTRPPRHRIRQPLPPVPIEVFSTRSTNYTDALPIASDSMSKPTDPFINFWGGNNCPFSFSTTGVYTVKNTKNIMTTAAIIVDGKYRENLMDEGIYNYIEKYTRTSGAAKDGLYCYNYTLDTNPRNVQPTGSINYSKFTKIELELTTINPPMNKDNTFNTICRKDESTQMSEQIGVIQSYDSNFKYRFEVVFMEERYNIIKFIGGNVGLVFSN
jgi:hypothetical protein